MPAPFRLPRTGEQIQNQCLRSSTPDTTGAMPAELELATNTPIPQRSTSSSPSLLPTPISSCFSSNRSVSGISSISSRSASSNPSITTRSVSGSGSKRRGYVRPQGANFAPSAQNRESVMSLGSIAHLQYYFARTGLLEGKAGRMAKKNQNGEYDIPKLSLSNDKEIVESPIDEEAQLMWEAAQEDGEEVMLPPTVSTYSHRSDYIPPPPDHKTLKRELVETLENALQALESCDTSNADSENATQGFYEIQGLHILDTVTLAIKAARIYYTQHPHPKRLSTIRPHQRLRKELFAVLDILKMCASRNFAGGFREDERLSVLVWVSEVGMMIDQEAKIEEREKMERKDWEWMDDLKWIDNEHGRDMNFLHFVFRKARQDPEDLLPPTTEFFKGLADGRDLVAMHNAAVKESKRQFDFIDSFHADVAKPYRRADNLRYFTKAAELRFEVKLKFDVMAVANLKEDEATWSGFEDALRLWAKTVRTELTKDWNGEEERKLHMRAKSLANASPFGSPARKTKISNDSSPMSSEVSLAADES